MVGQRQTRTTQPIRALSGVRLSTTTTISCCMATLSFAQTELERALSEQTFGIEGYKILGNDVLESTAEVVTLEGAKITLTLSTRGYQVRLSFCLSFPHYTNA